MNHFLMTTGVIPVGSVWATMGQIAGQEFPEDIRQKAFALGERLVAAWKNKETTAEYDLFAPQFAERMRSLVLWRRQEWPYEYEHWKEFRGLK